MPLEEVEVIPLDPQRFRAVLSADGRETFERAIRRGQELLRGRVVWSVNSTARGGGVAEMLRSLIATSEWRRSTRAGPCSRGTRRSSH